jgi:arginyl-tRNA synthetase
LLVDQLTTQLGWSGEVTEKNGFINFRMNDEALNGHIAQALEQGERYGSGEALEGKRVLVEFVSADPTGPLPFSLGRIAAAGDSLCRILAFAGADVTREFYLNDVETSTKMRLLGESVAVPYLAQFGHEVEPPEGALDDNFIREVAAEIAAADGNRWLLVPDAERTAHFAHRAREAAVAHQRETLKQFGVRFDVWTSESALREEGRVESAVKKLRERGQAYDREGTVWLRSSNFGDEADRVLVRAKGNPTYFAADIAYHVFKLERGFDAIINIWTAEHRPYIERTRAGLKAIGADGDKLEVVASEGARWMRDEKQAVRGREGGAFTLDEALADAPRDNLRFLLVQSNWDEAVTLERDRARRDDESNPAYAARLLPSRLGTQIRELEARGSASSGDSKSDDAAGSAWSAEERAIARLIAQWPDIVENAAIDRAPHRVAAFVSDLAAAVRADLKASRPADTSNDAARLKLLKAAKVAAQNALTLLGVKAADQF